MGEQGSHSRVFVGMADKSPKPHTVNPVHVLEMVGAAGAAVLAGAKIRSMVARGPHDNLSPLQISATQQAELPKPQQIKERLPQWILSGIGKLTVRALVPDERTQDGVIGTAQVYIETPTDIVLLTAEHVGKFLWRDATIHFPYGDTNTLIHVDARKGAKGGPKPTDNDWWIRYVSPSSDVEKGILHPIRTIIIAKPKGFDRYVTPAQYGVLRASADPKPGDEYTVGGFADDAREALVFSRLTFMRMTKPGEVPYAGIPLMMFSGSSGQGMSGGSIMRDNGTIAAILSGGDKSGHNVLGIPFSEYQPIAEVNRILNPSP